MVVEPRCSTALHLRGSTKIIPIVTFPDTTEVKVVAKKTHIINNRELLNIIESYPCKVYSYNDIYTIKYYLENGNTNGTINDFEINLRGNMINHPELFVGDINVYSAWNKYKRKFILKRTELYNRKINR